MEKNNQFIKLSNQQNRTSSISDGMVKIASWLKHARFFLFCLALIFVIFFLSYLTILRSMDSILYDLLTRYSTVKPSPRNTVLVEIKFDDLSNYNNLWTQVISNLTAQAPKGIVFGFLPEEASPDFYTKVGSDSNVIFARHLQQNPNLPTELILEPLPLQFQNKPFTFGVLSIPPLKNGGIYKYEYLHYNLDNLAYPTLELASYLKFGPESKKIPSTTNDMYLVNFKGGANSLARIQIEKVISNDLIPELIKDKIILIGFAKDPYLLSLRTPAKSEDNLISLLEFQAFALDTLLNNDIISEVEKTSFLLILLFIGIGSLVVYFYATGLISLIFTIALTILYVVVSWFSLIYMNLWLPIFPVLLVQYLLFLVVSRKETQDEEKAAKNILLNLTLKLHERIYPTNFYMSEDYWMHLVVMIDQVLPLEKSIFLEKVPNDHRVKEIKALRCSLKDINELRRDYTRTPYSIAIAENDLIEVQNYFKKNENEQPQTQYLIPLQFLGQVLGFWAFTIDSENDDSQLRFKKVIKMFADEVSGLLYQREYYRKQLSKNTFWKNFFSFQDKKLLLDNVYKSISLIERQLVNLESIFNNSSTASIYYDLFGKVLKINHKMTEILKAEAIIAFDLSVSELINKLSNIEIAEARKYLEKVIVEHQVITLPMTLAKSKMSGAIKVQALSENTNTTTDTGIAIPFRLTGILLEIIETTK